MSSRMVKLTSNNVLKTKQHWVPTKTKNCVKENTIRGINFKLNSNSATSSYKGKQASQLKLAKVGTVDDVSGGDDDEPGPSVSFNLEQIVAPPIDLPSTDFLAETDQLYQESAIHYGKFSYAPATEDSKYEDSSESETNTNMLAPYEVLKLIDDWAEQKDETMSEDGQHTHIEVRKSYSWIGDQLVESVIHRVVFVDPENDVYLE